MNIFYLDKDPDQAAVWMVDRHVVKMIVESAQLLSTAHRYIDGFIEITSENSSRWALNDFRDAFLYKATHLNHPSNIWVRKTIGNYSWLKDHFVALLNEYTYRYGKIHKTAQLLPILSYAPRTIQLGDMTEVPCAMPDEFKISSDPIQNYRCYYSSGKSHLHAWTGRKPPEWLNVI